MHTLESITSIIIIIIFMFVCVDYSESMHSTTRVLEYYVDMHNTTLLGVSIL